MSQSNAKRPALLSLVETKWLQLAEQQFQNGQQAVFFVFNTELGLHPQVPRPHHVYFKTSGGVSITARAEFVDITDQNPRTERLPGSEDELGKYYFGFRNLEWIEPITLNSVQFYRTGNIVPNSHPGTCLVRELPDDSFHRVP
jgi:hypothetical protein